jgi:holliday junction DNA helicase RuvA
MIGSITGIPRSLKENIALVDVRGVGYKIHTTKETLFSINDNLGNPITFFTYLSVRETALDLYGFTTMGTLETFELLLQVSGIGPKSALGVLDAVDSETLINAIASNDASHLTKVSGIGKKTAEKIVHELKDKVKGVVMTKEEMSSDGDVILALEALGWNGSEVRNILKDIPKEGTTNERIRFAIQLLGK